jgi:hypothetical protein
LRKLPVGYFGLANLVITEDKLHVVIQDSANSMEKISEEEIAYCLQILAP